MRTYRFHTNIDGRTFRETVQGRTISEAVATLRASLRDGETIVGQRDDRGPAMIPEQEVEALRALLRKVQNSVGWWAALSYVDGVRGSKSRWSESEQELLYRAGL